MPCFEMHRNSKLAALVVQFVDFGQRLRMLLGTTFKCTGVEVVSMSKGRAHGVQSAATDKRCVKVMGDLWQLLL